MIRIHSPTRDFLQAYGPPDTHEKMAAQAQRVELILQDWRHARNVSPWKAKQFLDNLTHPRYDHALDYALALSVRPSASLMNEAVLLGLAECFHRHPQAPIGEVALRRSAAVMTHATPENRLRFAAHLSAARSRIHDATMRDKIDQTILSFGIDRHDLRMERGKLANEWVDEWLIFKMSHHSTAQYSEAIWENFPRIADVMGMRRGPCARYPHDRERYGEPQEIFILSPRDQNKSFAKNHLPFRWWQLLRTRRVKAFEIEIVRRLALPIPEVPWGGLSYAYHDYVAHFLAYLMMPPTVWARIGDMARELLARDAPLWEIVNFANRFDLATNHLHQLILNYDSFVNVTYGHLRTEATHGLKAAWNKWSKSVFKDFQLPKIPAEEIEVLEYLFSVS